MEKETGITRTRANLLKAASLLLCAATITYLAFALYLQEQSDPKLLWGLLDHDRHAHYGVALTIAECLGHADVVGLFRELDGCRVWPPLHGIITGMSIAAFGLDHRTAYLPNLFWWGGTAGLVFLLARNAMPRWGEFGGFIALWLYCSSPLFKMFATDIMLEQLGAFLLLLSLLLYLRAKEQPDRIRYTHLALSMTALFFEKYNYWTIACLSMMAFEVIAFRHAIFAGVKTQIQNPAARSWLKSALFDPIHWLLAVTLALLLAGVATKSRMLGLSERRFSFRKDHYVPLAGYVAIVLWLCVHAWRHRQWIKHGFDSRFRAVLIWNFLPIGVSFLLPGRLGHFLWFMADLDQNIGPHHSRSLGDGLNFYSKAIFNYFHFAPWAAWLALGLACIGALSLAIQRSRHIVLFGVLALGSFLTFSHPNCQDRHACIWMPLVWALSGIGAAAILQLLERCFLWLFRSLQSAADSFAASQWCRLATSGVCALLVLTVLPGTWERGRSQELVDQKYFPNSQKIFDALLANLSPEDQVTFFASLPLKKIAKWRFLERCHDVDRFELFIKGFNENEAENRTRFAKWEQTAKANKVVFVDIPPGTPFFFDGFPQYQMFRSLLAENPHWTCEKKQTFEDSNVVVWVWTRPIPGIKAIETAMPNSGELR